MLKGHHGDSYNFLPGGSLRGDRSKFVSLISPLFMNRFGPDFQELAHLGSSQTYVKIEKVCGLELCRLSFFKKFPGLLSMESLQRRFFLLYFITKSLMMHPSVTI